MSDTSVKKSVSHLKPETPIMYVKGVGPKRATVLEKSGIHTLENLLYYFPRKHLDRSTITDIASLKIGIETTIVGKILSQSLVMRRRLEYYQILVADETGTVKCIWFNGVKYIKNVFKNGDIVAMSGRVEFYRGLQLVHPEYDRLRKSEWDPLHTSRIIPLYPTSAELKSVGLDSRGFRRLMLPVLENLQLDIPDTLPNELRLRLHMMGLNEAFYQIHFPESVKKLKAAQDRFKFEELFFLQLILGVKRLGIKSGRKPFNYERAGPFLKKIYENLPFQLTASQKRVVKEIWSDMKSGEVMNRLLQGDVGSGKTIVALLCASIAIGNGYQAAVMAPTEILAEQHFRNLTKLCKPVGISVELLIGGQSKKERDRILENIKDGSTNLIVGTHALIQESIEFKNLTFVVIDEQHRFGVVQRSQLISKGLNPDVLVMTATPIPRTLSMTLYGDMDVSTLDELPARKGKIITRLINEDRIADTYKFVEDKVKEGNQVYIVYPLIEESKKLDLKAATEGYDYLKTHVFPNLKLSLLHGAMSSTEKDLIMHEFSEGTIDILVSTTVIEVGVDNPNANVMLIENSERFGLTQLHQMRGRIGRGDRDGFCILVERKRTEVSKRRLDVILSSTNGFEISDDDLKLRGPGEFFSTRQHGYPKMKIADLLTDKEHLKTARKEAFDLLESDPHLRRTENREVRKCLLNKYSEYLEYINIL